MTKTRVLAALLMAPLAILAILFLPTPWMAALAAILFLLGLWEWLKLAEIDDTLQRTVLLVLNLLLMVLLLWASGRPLVLLQIAALVGVGWWVVSLLWLRFYNFASDHDTHARVFKLAAGTLATLPAWCALVLIHSDQPYGHRWLLTALMIVWAADSGAYFAGRQFGRMKLAPRISPNKTVEGLAGGLLAGIVVGLVMGWYAGATVVQLPALMLLCAVTVLFSVVGDLFESLLKRHVGAKDSGTLIPGHGGILDRIDGVLAALPVFLIGKEMLGL
ncbi:phosphatidate cytidylyltransferase [Luteimonas panaciterrae]|uniref:phosphatidate cytidylyltransferase n=1 Tax=Luteimonas panaciterrae TaxID=363885 RepID=UPI001CFA5673|nr:phosphatidate cytidylyltransferase [Luteimonas panaciterrae]